ncbi:MAG TPA: sigma-54 dependent transcriptional regulator [Pyrinomonadaceae bacterium]|nr:sigma-54 dependent transcriptional regulator [Pyrinomonadaceae bacterium]
MKTKILVVEDDARLRSLLLESIALEGHSPEGLGSAEEAFKRLQEEKFDILLTDVNLPGKTGLEILPVCLQSNPNAYMLVMTGFGTIDTAVQAMKLGAADFLCKPVGLSDLISAIRVAVEKIQQTPSPVTILTVSNSPLIAKSAVMLNLLEQVKTIAPYKINVLVTGETGTGKELIAKAIHFTSPRADAPFVALNCAAVPEQLLEDELFGHVKGAFTGAQTDRKGRFEQADGGTLFLDEIGDMNMALQSKLLRVLQESEFEKLGSSKTVKVDVRVVAATSANLDKKIADGSFRPDLYHRLNVVHLRVPPLRERPDDIMPIAQGLLEKFCKSVGLPEKTIADEAHHSLISYSFPGNVRQLQNCMERAAVFSGISPTVNLEHFPEEIKNQQNLFQIPTATSFIPSTIPDEGIDFTGVVSQVERELLLQTLEKTGGNKMQAAKLLNMKRTTLVEKIKRLHIETEEETDKEEVFVGEE